MIVKIKITLISTIKIIITGRIIIAENVRKRRKYNIKIIVLKVKKNNNSDKSKYE